MNVKTGRIRPVLMLVLAVVMMLTVGGAAVHAQDASTTPAQVELVGLIQAMSMDTIAVNGQIVNVASAELKTSLEIGKAVKVEAAIAADGSLIAREVQSPDDTDGSMFPGEIEVTGTLTDFTGTTMVVGGFTVNVLGAEIGDGISVGLAVKVHAAAVAGGTWQAREVHLVTAEDAVNSNDNTSMPVGDEFEFRGTLEAIGDRFIVVGGQTVDTTDAEIKTSLVLGALVKVHASLVNGQLVAREVELSGTALDNSNDNASFNDNGNDNSDDNGNDNADDGAVTVPADCVPTQPAGWVIYTIQSGDTLSRIAEGANARLSEIALANCIRDPRFIVAGVSIFVPQTPTLSNDNSSNDNSSFDDNGNDNDSFNDNGDDHGNDNGSSNDNVDDHGGNSGSDSNDNGDD